MELSGPMELSGIAAGVPYRVLPPAGGPRPDAPVVVGYHLLDAPRTEAAFASAVPLTGLDAWKVYFGLPMSGARLPSGGPDELRRLVMRDAVLNVHQYVTLGAAAEFPEAYASVCARLGIDRDVPLGVMGGSMGGAVGQLVLTEAKATAGVFINPVVRFRDTIDALSAFHGVPYQWTPEADAVADRLDFVRRADELSHAAVRYLTGADDMVDAIIEPVRRVVPELAKHGAQVDWQVVAGMAHALADEPGTEAAPQTPHAAEVDRLAVEWFRQHL